MNSSNKLNVNKGVSRLPKKESLISSLASNLRTTIAIAALAASSLVNTKTATAENPFENTQACQSDRAICGPVRGASESFTFSAGYQSTNNPFKASALSAAGRFTIPTGPDSDNFKPSPGLDFLFRSPLDGNQLSLELDVDYTLLNSIYGDNEHIGRGHLGVRWQENTWFLGAGLGYTDLVTPIDGGILINLQGGLKAKDLTFTLGADLIFVGNDADDLSLAGFARANYQLNPTINIYAQGSRGFETNPQDNLESVMSFMAGLQFSFGFGQVDLGVGSNHPAFSQDGFEGRLGAMFMTPKPQEQAPQVPERLHIIQIRDKAYQTEVDAQLTRLHTASTVNTGYRELPLIYKYIQEVVTPATDDAPAVTRANSQRLRQIRTLVIDFSRFNQLTSQEKTKSLEALLYLMGERIVIFPSGEQHIPQSVRARIIADSRAGNLSRNTLSEIKNTGIHAHFHEIASNQAGQFPYIDTTNGHERIFYAENQFVEANNAHFIQGKLFEVIDGGLVHRIRFIKQFAISINAKAPVLNDTPDHSHSHNNVEMFIQKIQGILQSNPGLTAEFHHHGSRITFQGWFGQFDSDHIINDDSELSIKFDNDRRFKLTLRRNMGIGAIPPRVRTFRKR